jgi:hypothetical protein
MFTAVRTSNLNHLQFVVLLFVTAQFKHLSWDSSISKLIGRRREDQGSAVSRDRISYVLRYVETGCGAGG